MSLSRQLVVSLLAVLTCVLTASGVVVYLSVRAHLYHQFDQALSDRFTAWSHLIEQDVEGVELDWEDQDEGLESEYRLGYLQVWLADGASLTRSPRLGRDQLPRLPNPALNTPRYHNFTLPNGDPARAIGVTFHAHQDEDLPPDTDRIAVELVVAQDLLDVSAVLAGLRNTLLTVWAAAIVLTVVAMIRVVQSACRPLGNLSRQIHDLDESSLRQHLATDGLPSEIAPVIDRLNGLMTRMAKAFDREKQLTANVAHELRTPLSGLRTTLEVTLSRPREPDAYVETAKKCLDMTCQLQRLVENVLSLAKLQAAASKKQIKSIDPKELMHRCWSLCSPQAERRGLKFDWNMDVPKSLTIRTDPDMLGMVFTNLFDNAANYATAHSTVHVHAIHRDRKLSISITNPANRMTAKQIEYAFEPFWRDDEARASNGKNTGLGLSLCQKLMDVLGGTIAVSCEGDNQFRVDLEIVDESKPGTSRH